MSAQKKADGIPVHCAHTEIRDTSKLVGNPRNPNQHPESQIALPAKIIEAQGWRNPITVSKRSGFVVRGHGRLLAARLLGVSKVPIDEQAYSSEAAEWADLIADNRIAELADLDFTMTADLLLEIDAGEFDMEVTGYTEAEIEQMMTSVSVGEPDEQPGEPKTATCPQCGHVFTP